MKERASVRRLTLNREVVRQLDETLADDQLRQAAGGVTPITGICRYSLYVQCLTQAPCPG